ncbi:MAG: phosphopantothenoylcysteine decarboxylase [Phycisphaerales bacterium]|nr:phosphopantothenoylcysteine decarboxylase [Phycisphaerales bacterium]
MANVDPKLLGGVNVLVGVAGGIAAYKSAALVSKLAQSGAGVTVAMTEAAAKFVTPLTFQALSGRPVYTSPWDHIESADPQHIALARNCHVAIVAPCTMDCMAKLATGRCDDIVTLILSAIDRSATRVLLAPAMNAAMWAQPANQRNVKQLIADGFAMIGPDEGWQACRTSGPGRMTEPDALFDAIVAATKRR